MSLGRQWGNRNSDYSDSLDFLDLGGEFLATDFHGRVRTFIEVTKPSTGIKPATSTLRVLRSID